MELVFDVAQNMLCPDFATLQHMLMCWKHGRDKSLLIFARFRSCRVKVPIQPDCWKIFRNIFYYLLPFSWFWKVENISTTWRIKIVVRINVSSCIIYPFGWPIDLLLIMVAGLKGLNSIKIFCNDCLINSTSEGIDFSPCQNQESRAKLFE